MMQGDEIGNVAPGLEGGIFDANKTEWMPIGNMMDKIKSNLSNLPEEYSTMAQYSKRLSRRTPNIDIEDVISDKLVLLHNTFFDPYKRVKEPALAFAFKVSPNTEAIIEFMESVGENTEDIESILNSSGYAPRTGETLFSYIRRT